MKTATFKKTKKVIESCETLSQLQAADIFIDLADSTDPFSIKQYAKINRAWSNTLILINV